MAESVDALVSNTSGATHPGSSPGLGTRLKQKDLLLRLQRRSFICFLFWSSATESAAEAAATESARTIAPASATPTAPIASARAVLTTEEVQSIADVQHGIRGDGVDLLVTPAIGIDGP